MRIAFVFWTAICLGCLQLDGEPGARFTSCPVIARLPADLKDTEPPDYRLWFELRQCNGGNLFVQGYERHKSKPSLAFDTDYPYPVQLVHIPNVLVMESRGGSTNHVFVFTFKDGKPIVALSSSTNGGVRVKQTEQAVIVAVPQKMYPGTDGKFPSAPDEVYRFSIE